MLLKVLCFVAVLGLSQSLGVPSEIDERSTAGLGELNRYLHYIRARPWTEVSLFHIAEIKAEFINNTQVIIIVHGHEGTATTSINPDLKDEILTHYDNVNVVIVDWAGVAGSHYDYASGAVPSIAHNLALFIGNVIMAGFPEDKIHLIGFDLGAHICGFAGRAFNGRLGQITGLSPSGPGWADTRGPLVRGDARIVEIIHTNNNLGIDRALGHRDIYINNGRVQPGCSNHQCHHHRAHQIMTASIAHRIVGNTCATVADMTSNRCAGGRALRVGSLDFRMGSGILRANTVAGYPFAT